MHLLHPHLVWQTFLRCREFKKHITLLLLLFILHDWRLSLVTLMFRFCSGFFGASYSNSSWKMHGQVNLLCNLNIHVSIEVKVILAVRLQQDSNLWPPWYQCDTLPTELSSLTGSRSGASSIYTCYYILIWSLSYIYVHIICHTSGSAYEFVVVVFWCFSEIDYTAPCNCSSCGIFSITGNKYLGQNTDT